ncbi:hypothetical protein CI610_02169 [invertebrate metagenome]|uniref:Uncharacterized protein n=1 Tax=invertebrate metagenome TaxID=1711999 RepID=A0A2H9T6P1_9ZZZZ
MPVMEASSEEEQFNRLRDAFRTKIFPLLEEYFFEDWEKIRLVLGDNQKKEERLQFVIRSRVSATELFGAGYDSDSMDEPTDYRINEAALDNPEAYRRITGPLNPGSFGLTDSVTDDSAGTESAL